MIDFKKEKCNIKETIKFFKLKEKIITLQLQQDSVILDKLETIFDSMVSQKSVQQMQEFLKKDSSTDDEWEQFLREYDAYVCYK
jgi:hypothetical protein